MASKDQTRQQIIEAAQGLFTRYGPIKTSVADIAREVGMSAANIYNFFASRDAILEAVGAYSFATLKQEIREELALVCGDWARIEILFISSARHMRDKLDNEKDIIQLQALVTKNQWMFVIDFHDFLRAAVAQILREAVAAGRLRHDDVSAAIPALFDCMMSALDPLLILRFSRADHLRRISAQLSLLERAFR